MKTLKPALIALSLAFGCGPTESRLTEETWLIKKGYYEGREINFNYNSASLLLTQGEENHLPLYFAEDKTVRLPGQGSFPIPAKWEFMENKIHFTLDTTNFDKLSDEDHQLELTSLFEKDTVTLDSLRRSHTEKVNLQQTELKDAFTIYERPFTIRELNDNGLVLESETTTIYAVRFNPLTELLQ